MQNLSNTADGQNFKMLILPNGSKDVEKKTLAHTRMHEIMQTFWMAV